MHENANFLERNVYFLKKFRIFPNILNDQYTGESKKQQINWVWLKGSRNMTFRHLTWHLNAKSI